VLSGKVLDQACRIESDPQWATLFDELRVDAR
jgi:hypothetical protein